MKSVADTDRANENKNSLEIRDERGEGERRDEERTRKFCVLDVKEENLIAKFNTSLSLSHDYYQKKNSISLCANTSGHSI